MSKRLIHTNASSLIALRQLKVLWGSYKASISSSDRDRIKKEIKKKQEIIEKNKPRVQYKYKGFTWGKAGMSVATD
jgi:hypothetical protein